MSEANSLINNITIIVAVYNGAKTMQACLDSIVRQTYPYVELIVMDGGSLDGTIEILRNNAHHLSFWDSQKDRGIAHAWNKARNHTTGKWVLFLGSDDRLLDENVLADMTEILSNDITHDVIYGKCLTEGGEFHGKIWGGGDITALRRRMCIPHIATFHRREFMEAVGPFDETFRMAMDYELLLRKKLLSARFVDRLVTVMGGEGVSARMIKNSLLESRKAQIKNQADWRIKIEAWHAVYQFRHIFNQMRNK